MAIGDRKPESADCLGLMLLKFNQELLIWLNKGGEQRLLEFGPLDAWRPVVEFLVERTEKHSVH